MCLYARTRNLKFMIESWWDRVIYRHLQSQHNHGLIPVVTGYDTKTFCNGREGDCTERNSQILSQNQPACSDVVQSQCSTTIAGNKNVVGDESNPVNSAFGGQLQYRVASGKSQD